MQREEHGADRSGRARDAERPEHEEAGQAGQREGPQVEDVGDERRVGAEAPEQPDEGQAEIVPALGKVQQLPAVRGAEAAVVRPPATADDVLDEREVELRVVDRRVAQRQRQVGPPQLQAPGRDRHTAEGHGERRERREPAPPGHPGRRRRRRADHRRLDRCGDGLGAPPRACRHAAASSRNAGGPRLCTRHGAYCRAPRGQVNERCGAMPCSSSHSSSAAERCVSS